MSDPYMVTAAENAVVVKLADAWNAFLMLPVEHSDDQCEFRHAIHSAQDKVLSRAGRRQVNG
jgi:hypothetical protein